MGMPTVISLFAGCGGSSLGYKMAGYRELLAVDFDRNSVKTFRLNFPEVPCWQRDIMNVSGNEILDFCKIRRGELDVLDGSPPCQGFSTAGKRMVNDSRNNMFKEYARIVNDLQPKVFLMENVSGMIKGKMKGKFIEIMRTLKGLDYNVKCKLMDAKYYGVPQSRQRLIFIGVRNDLNIEPSFPRPNNKYITVRDAIANIPNGKGLYYKPRERSIIAIYIRKIRRGEIGAKYHPNGNFFNLRRLKWNRPSYTICKNAGRNIIHPSLDRFITDIEAARLSSFPDSFKFTGMALERISRIGNAVMPRFMQAIALHIRKKILASNDNT